MYSLYYEFGARFNSTVSLFAWKEVENLTIYPFYFMREYL